jgi:hypothetical protein
MTMGTGFQSSLRWILPIKQPISDNESKIMRAGFNLTIRNPCVSSLLVSRKEISGPVIKIIGNFLYL